MTSATVTDRTRARAGDRPVAAPPRRGQRTGLLRYWREYLAISPFFVLFAAFGVIPLIFAVYLSTQKWDGLGASLFVGWDQWVRLFNTPDVWLALSNTFVIFAMGQIPVVIAALIGATLVSLPRLRFRSFYQTAFFLPQVTSLVAVAIVFQSIFGTRFGLVNHLLGFMGLPAQRWLEDPVLIKIVIAMMIIWRGFGYFLVIFLAGMASIDPALYEAARVDGAGPIRILWSITLPMLIPTILFVSLTATISGLQMFTEPQILFSGTGGPNNSALTMMLLQFQYLGGPSTGAQTVLPDLGFATVIGWVIFIILVALGALGIRGLRSAQTRGRL
jgi:cellobiose transport system permease protein